eukprot:8887111-Alexandrium_andersonii.AAC.1
MSLPTKRSAGSPWRAKAEGWLLAVAQSSAVRKSRRTVMRSVVRRCLAAGPAGAAMATDVGASANSAWSGTTRMRRRP